MLIKYIYNVKELIMFLRLFVTPGLIGQRLIGNFENLHN